MLSFSIPTPTLVAVLVWTSSPANGRPPSRCYDNSYKDNTGYNNTSYNYQSRRYCIIRWYPYITLVIMDYSCYRFE